jgi:ABC-2 type transport system permease protein
VIQQARAEVLKIQSTRTTAGLLAGMVGLVLLIVILTASLSHVDSLSSAEDQRNLLGIGSTATLFAALAGVLVIASEFRFGTIHPTFLVTPQRTRVVSAKLVAGILAGLVFGLVAEVLAFGIGRGILSARGIDSSLDGRDVTLLLVGSIVGSALWGGIGVGLGAIVRNQVAAVIGLLAWALVVDNLLFGLAPSVGRFTPSASANALLGLDDSDLLAPGAGGAMLVVWVAALAAVGIALIQRRDVG